jgi:nucleoside-diphosphate-sugar epimerase
MATAFVTGGSGFIGGRLVRRLTAEGWTVRALARSERSDRAIEVDGGEPVRGDLSDVDAMAAGAEGCDVAFHLAAHLGTWGTREEFERGNVEGTRNAVTACRRSGVRRFVHAGTEAALLAGKPLVKVDETAPRRPDSPALYAATKAQAEEVALSASGDGFETVSLRPRLVWGKGDTSILPNLVRTVESGKFAWIGGGRHLTDTTHVDNVVEGMMLAAESGRPGEAYFVTDGDPVVFRDFITELLVTQGVEAPDRSMPSWLARAAAAGSELTWRTLRLNGEPPITRLAYWLSAQECTLDISKARRELGYEPVKSREEGLAELR